jgi:hypothetical protein
VEYLAPEDGDSTTGIVVVVRLWVCEDVSFQARNSEQDCLQFVLYLFGLWSSYHASHYVLTYQ